MVTRFIAVTLSLALAAPAVTMAQAPNCANIADQFDRDTRAFTAEADRQNLQFVTDLALEKITSALKERLKEPFEGTVANDIAEHVNESWEMANAARGHLARARDYFNEWLRCITAPRGSCNVEALNKQYLDAFKAYMDSLLERAGLAEAQSRVERARSLLHNYLDRTMNISTGTMSAMAQCTAPMRQARVQLTESATPPANATENLPEVAEPPSTPVTGTPNVTRVSGGGGASGKMIGGVLAVVGGAAAGLYVAQQVGSGVTDDFSNTGGGASTGTTSNTPSVTGARRFDGTYDFSYIRTGPGGTQTTVNVPRYLILNNGSLTTTEGTISGSVDADGNFRGNGVCPINELGADWTGRFTTSGTGSGNYTCRFGGISRTWTATRR